MILQEYLIIFLSEVMVLDYNQVWVTNLVLSIIWFSLKVNIYIYIYYIYKFTNLPPFYLLKITMPLIYYSLNLKVNIYS